MIAIDRKTGNRIKINIDIFNSNPDRYILENFDFKTAVIEEENILKNTEIVENTTENVVIEVKPKGRPKKK